MANNKNIALGMNYSTASAQLKKLLMFQFMGALALDSCHQCGKLIETADQLSVEHKTPWLAAEDPKATFFDLDNIAFSHLSCNSGAADKSYQLDKDTCKQGHSFDKVNTKVTAQGWRQCRMCKQTWNADRYK